jgi:hypothetical protein
MKSKIVNRWDKAKANSRRRRHERAWKDVNLPPRDMWSDQLEREILRMRF